MDSKDRYRIGRIGRIEKDRKDGNDRGIVSMGIG